MINTRAVAVRTLLSMFEQGRSMDKTLNGLPSPLLRELVYGVARWYWRLKAYADQLLKKPLRAKDSDVMMLILVGLYQLVHLRVPVYASINETVRACEHLGKGWAKGLVNAVLRSYLRRKDELDVDLPDVAKYCHPSWIIESVSDSWPAHWREILSANNERPPMVLRVNRQRIDRSSYLQRLSQNNISAVVDPLSGDGVLMDKPVDVDELPGFSDGLVSVQDTVAQWAADVLPAHPGNRVLDACAAPGGKLTHILEAHQSLAEVIAIDISQKRVDLIKDNLARLGLSAKLLVADAADPSTWWDGTLFDCIVIDAPCTGTGVIRRRPEIKHLRRPEDLGKSVEKQAALLDHLWRTLNSHGYLLYITCSILKEENEAQIERFSTTHSDVEIRELDLPTGEKSRYGLQTLPGVHKVDGFYYSLMQKKVA